jgi:superfamily I DNA/RNA helicase
MGPAARAVTRFIQAAAGSAEIGEWLALAGELRGIGPESLVRLEEALPLTGDFLALAAGVALPSGAERAVAELAAALDRFRDAVSREGIAPALGPVLPFLGVDAGHPDVCRLTTLAGSFGRNLETFARHLRDSAAETLYDERAEGVPLMTLHAAKGLEFPVVFLAGCEEGLLPCTLWRDVDLEEERRLFYVGMTRAKEALILTASRERPWCGPGERPLSRFVGEIPARLVSAVAPDKARQGKKTEQLELF